MEQGLKNVQVLSPISIHFQVCMVIFKRHKMPYLQRITIQITINENNLTFIRKKVAHQNEKHQSMDVTQ